MKSTVISLVHQYGITRIHYSVIIFGTNSTTYIDFSDTLPNKDYLIRLVSRLEKSSGKPDLAKAMEDVKKVYELQQVRPNAKRVLVVILDNKSVNTVNQLNKIVPVLVDKGVLVISVAVGRSVDKKESEIITEENRNIIVVGVNEKPNELVKKIMTIILRSKFIYFL